MGAFSLARSTSTVRFVLTALPFPYDMMHSVVLFLYYDRILQTLVCRDSSSTRPIPRLPFFTSLTSCLFVYTRCPSANHSLLPFSHTPPPENNHSRDSWFTVAPRDQRIETQLFGAQLSGINFDKYEDIPVEASGNDCPKPIDSVC